MSENPFESPAAAPDSPPPGPSPSNAVLWRAYLLAPGVAPITFILMLGVFLLLAGIFNVEVNPASFLILPLLALTLGMIVCYAVAGAIGMPIAFFLRNRGRLNGTTIHGAALGWAVLFCGALSMLSILDAPHQVPIVFAYLMCCVAPPVLLSGTAFWLLVRQRAGAL